MLVRDFVFYSLYPSYRSENVREKEKKTQLLPRHGRVFELMYIIWNTLNSSFKYLIQPHFFAHRGKTSEKRNKNKKYNDNYGKGAYQCYDFSAMIKIPP